MRKIIDILGDERSRDIYLHLLKCRTNALYPDEIYVSWDSYFVNPAFRIFNMKDVLIDCGAFVGDTIERFISQHECHAKKIIGFEPEPKNFIALSKRITRLREEWNLSDEALSVYPYGVSDKSSVSYIHRNENRGIESYMTSKAEENSHEVRTVALDDFLDGDRVTFIKADIESYEYRMLKGAAKSITKWHPRLGICIYHNATDFYSIPLFVKKLLPECKLMIRHHAVEAAETILYAW